MSKLWYYIVITDVEQSLRLSKQLKPLEWCVVVISVITYKASSSGVCSSTCPVAHQEINASSARGSFVTSSYAWVYYYVYLTYFVPRLAPKTIMQSLQLAWVQFTTSRTYIIIFYRRERLFLAICSRPENILRQNNTFTSTITSLQYIIVLVELYGSQFK